jgi:hypothetical protein
VAKGRDLPRFYSIPGQGVHPDLPAPRMIAERIGAFDHIADG